MIRGAFRPVHDLLWRSLPEDARRRMRFQDAARDWESVVGVVLARKSALVDLEGKNAIAVADSPAAAQELLLRRGIVLKSLKERWGLLLEGFFVRVGNFRPSYRAQEPTEPEPLDFPSEEVVASVRQEVCAMVEDDGVAESLARMWAAYRRKYPGENP